MTGNLTGATAAGASGTREGKEAAERAHLSSLLQELDEQVDALREQIGALQQQAQRQTAEREKRWNAVLGSSSGSGAVEGDIDAQAATPSGSAQLITDAEIEKALKGLDDNAL